jgi:hypothetical protein
MLLLDKYGADIDQPNYEDETPVQLAINYSQTECITALLKRGAATYGPDDFQNSPCCLAKQKEYGQLTNQFEGITTKQQWKKKTKQLSKLRVALAAKNKKIVELVRKLAPSSATPEQQTKEKGKTKVGSAITDVGLYRQPHSSSRKRSNSHTNELQSGSSQSLVPKF